MEVGLMLKHQAERAAKGKCGGGLLWISPKKESWRKEKHQHKGLKVAAQQNTPVAAPSNIRASCKKSVVTSRGTFSHFLQTS